LTVAVFGRPLELWRRHMPKGMLLRSHWWATNLSDPSGRYGFGRFLESSPVYQRTYPVPIDAFLEYGCWFQKHAVPDIDETYVSTVAKHDDGFVLTLEDGREIDSQTVVVATGPRYYANRPQEFRRLPPAFVSHTSDHSDLSIFNGKRVAVVGAGQSAIESAALLHERGATVDIVSRRPIQWLERDRTAERGLLERILAPANGLAPGWINWFLEQRPYVFYRLGQEMKDRQNAHWTATAAAWLKHRVLGNVMLHEGTVVHSTTAAGDRLRLTLSDRATLDVDHIMLATGYSVDLNSLALLDPVLRSEIRTLGNRPWLNGWFESSVPGLYFVGLASVHAFGPLYRFVAGCPAAASRVAASVAKTVRVRRFADVGCAFRRSESGELRESVDGEGSLVVDRP
jgi:thioredoxin reductase